MARFAAVICVFLLVAGAGPASAAPQNASEFIAGLADTSMSSLTAPDLPRAERAQRFRDLFEESFAVTGIARFVMGRHWRSATEAQREEFIEFLVQIVTNTWAKRSREFSRGAFQVVGETAVKSSRADEQDAIVRTAYAGDDGGVAINWRVANKGTIYKITDIQVEGVSMVTTYRDEMTAVIRKQGGTVDGLLAEMRQHLANITEPTL